MSDLDLLFDLKLTDQEETNLLGYVGGREVNKTGDVITVHDFRDLTKEKLKHKKQLKVSMNTIFLKIVPLQTQLNAALGQLTPVEIDKVKARMTKLRQLYNQEKIKIESANSLDSLVMPDLEKIISDEIKLL